MRHVGIDVGSEKHFFAVVDGRCEVLIRATPFAESREGYDQMLKQLGSPEDTEVALEATGHYWMNLFAELQVNGFSVALLNPLRTSRFAGEDLERTKTDAKDAELIARFSAQKRPVATRLADPVMLELRELVRHRERLVGKFTDCVRELHRLVDLGFPEFTNHITDLGSRRATAILKVLPTAATYEKGREGTLANLKYDQRHHVGRALAKSLFAEAQRSVGRHHGPAYQLQVRHACEDLDVLRDRIEAIEGDIKKNLERNEVGKLLTTIDGIGDLTAAKLIAELGDPAEFESGKALTAYVGIVPALRQSGKRQAVSAPICKTGNSHVRKALWMPTLCAVRHNPWLKEFYEGLRQRGKSFKVAIVASMRKLLLAVYSVAKSRRPFQARVAVEAP